MFKIRLRSSIILMVLTLFFVIMGKYFLFAAVLGISLAGMFELYRVVKIEKNLPGILGYTACIFYYFLIYFKHSEYFIVLFIAFLLLLMMIYVFTFPKFKTDQITIAFFGLFYVSVMLSYIYQVRLLDTGAIIVWLVFIGAWGSDTCAYCVGILIGRHKITPKLSPKKSVEGCIGGVVGAALIAMAYAAVFHNQLKGIYNPLLTFAIIGAAASIISQIGDLAASAIKRNHEVKDYSNLIPGHGGILDRFDSIIFTAPIVYYLAVLFQKGLG